MQNVSVTIDPIWIGRLYWMIAFGVFLRCLVNNHSMPNGWLAAMIVGALWPVGIGYWIGGLK